MASAKREAVASEIRKSYKKGLKACPVATQDVHVNLKNRNHAIKEYGYGPLNPNEPSRKFWQAKSDMWMVPAAEAKKSRCGNCAAFIQTPQMLKCMAEGIEGENAEDVMQASNLGYCEFFNFKCAGDRTCDAWIVGGPVK